MDGMIVGSNEGTTVSHSSVIVVEVLVVVVVVVIVVDLEVRCCSRQSNSVGKFRYHSVQSVVSTPPIKRKNNIKIVFLLNILFNCLFCAELGFMICL